MTVWVDADSCPRQVRDLVCAAARRLELEAVFVGNRPVPLGRAGCAAGSDGCAAGGAAPLIRMELVPAGEGRADRYIEEHASTADLVVTRDIPLAARLVERGITVLNDRGVSYTRESVRQRLIERDLMLAVRSSPDYHEGKPAYDDRKAKAFADCLERELCRLIRGGK